MIDLMRGIVDITNELPKHKLIVKAGFDPTSPDLHLGHLVLLKKLRDFQLLGHQIVIVVGDFTAMIGDPTGKNATRPQLSKEQVLANAEVYTKQVLKILDSSTKIVFNSTWWETKSASDMIKLASSITVARMLDRDDFKKRFNDHLPISVHEFLYPLLQGHDSVELKADVELGGNDQLFNLHMGRFLQERANQKPQTCITMPILLGTDGKQKMSKSIGNTINLTDNSYHVKQKILNMPDSNISSYVELLTDLDDDKSPLEMKKLLADTINDMLGNSDDALHLEIDDTISISGLVNRLDLAKNSAAARDMVSKGLVTIDDVVVDLDYKIVPSTFSIKVGKKEAVKCTITSKKTTL